MSTDSVAIELTLAERHTLTDLLTGYIQQRASEDAEFAQTSLDLKRAAERTRRLALLKALAEAPDEEPLPIADLDALRSDLVLSAIDRRSARAGDDVTTADETLSIPAVVPHIQRDAFYLVAQAGDEIGRLGERRELDPESFIEPFVSSIARGRCWTPSAGPYRRAMQLWVTSTDRPCSMVCA
jgi:hypothetical protein